MWLLLVLGILCLSAATAVVVFTFLHRSDEPLGGLETLFDHKVE